MDAVNNPGQLASKTTFKELYQPFRNKKNRLVPGVKEPHTGIEIDPLRMSGTPTLDSSERKKNARLVVRQECTGLRSHPMPEPIPH